MKYVQPTLFTLEFKSTERYFSYTRHLFGVRSLVAKHTTSPYPRASEVCPDRSDCLSFKLPAGGVARSGARAVAKVHLPRRQ